MIKKTKVSSYSRHKIDRMDRAKSMLTKRGVKFNYDDNATQIVIPTQQGRVVYYPLRGEYQHGLVRGYAENTESMIAYVVKCRVVNDEPLQEAEIEIKLHYDGVSFEELVRGNPLSILDAMEFNINDQPIVVEHKIAVIKNYGHAIIRCNQMLSCLSKGSDRHKEILAYTGRVTSRLGRLKVKYPFLKRGGSDFSSCLIECFKEDLSDSVWRSYSDRAHQKMIDRHFGRNSNV